MVTVTINLYKTGQVTLIQFATERVPGRVVITYAFPHYLTEQSINLYINSSWRKEKADHQLMIRYSKMYLILLEDWSILISGHLLYSIGCGKISSLRRQRNNKQDLHEFKAVSLPTVWQNIEINKLLKTITTFVMT